MHFYLHICKIFRTFAADLIWSIMQRILAIFIVCLFLLPAMAEKKAEKQYTLVLDAGHGGKDPGAVGRISKEKDLNLKLALEVGRLVKEQYPDVKVIYTRSTDVFIPLQERADIANKADADLFISIHTNSAESKAPCGVETFILGTEKMEQNLDVAMRENAVMKLEADYKTTYQGFDPNSIDSYIMFELMQNSHMEQSLQFATLVQNHFVGHLNREDRGVRQAAFWVLLKTACPSILFEMGFISNHDEERFLNQSGSITQMAELIVKSFGEYTHKQAVKQESLSKEPEKPATPQNTTVQPTPKDTREKILYYAVQIAASKIPLEPSDPRLKGIEYDTIHAGDWIKYYTAANPDRAKVSSSQQQLKPRYPDCWIIKFTK